MIVLLLACTSSSGGDTAPNGRDTADADTDADTDSDTDTDTDADTDTSDPGLLYAEGDGPFSVVTRDTTLADAATTVYAPAGDGPFPVVLWAHGFFRKKEQHAEAARHAATWGLLVVTPDLPNLSDHEANGEWLADELLPEAQALKGAGAEIVMVGHSAGGLATLIAAGRAHADVWVGLDPVDASNLGAGADQAVTGAALLLHGEEGTCNSDGSGYGWKTSGEQWTVKVTDANHCDFESDTDGTCTAFCGSQDSERADLIQEYATAWIVAQTGGDASAWLAGGAEAEADRSAGRVSW